LRKFLFGKQSFSLFDMIDHDSDQLVANRNMHYMFN